MAILFPNCVLQLIITIAENNAIQHEVHTAFLPGAWFMRPGLQQQRGKEQPEMLALGAVYNLTGGQSALDMPSSKEGRWPSISSTPMEV